MRCREDVRPDSSKGILKSTREAERVMQGVCTWAERLAENRAEFRRGQEKTNRVTTLAQKQLSLGHKVSKGDLPAEPEAMRGRGEVPASP